MSSFPSRNLILITDHFPFPSPTEKSFILPELNALRGRFGRILILPLQASASPLQLPEGIETDRILTDIMHSSRVKRIIRAIFSRGFLRPALSVIFKRNQPASLKKRMAMCVSAFTLSLGVEHAMNERGWTPANTSGYAFWAHEGAIALAFLSRRTGMKFVSRAHGVDLYHQRTPAVDGYLRRMMLENIRYLYAVSEAGTNYLKQRWPGFEDKISCRRLGSSKPVEDAITPCPPSGEVIFFSCARVSPEKRVGLNYGFTRRFAELNPDLRVRWIHAGGGNGFMELKKLTEEEIMAANYSVELKGEVDNSEVHHFFSTHPVSWFLLFSETEGNPISVAEAMSYGVPSVVTAAGGSPECVTPDSGFIIPVDCDIRKEAENLSPYLRDNKLRAVKGEEAFRRWNKYFSAARLRPEFADEISSV